MAQQQNPDNTITLDPMATYYRQKFHESEDQNALLNSAIGNLRVQLQQAQQKIAELEKKPAKKAASPRKKD